MVQCVSDASWGHWFTNSSGSCICSECWGLYGAVCIRLLLEALVYKQLWVLHMLRMLGSIRCSVYQTPHGGFGLQTVLELAYAPNATWCSVSGNQSVFCEDSCLNAIVTADRIDSVNFSCIMMSTKTSTSRQQTQRASQLKPTKPLTVLV
ncbi:hypothetical protein ElyMa_000509500 [Elysia marginata]|uniref:Uncharacterized protein n=1 Tax=Elysia marginata TaxID=1093978 RepID=A0AAV4FX35_9GAST|nr:hypothetical protein ElyMa_000509500 [Elysia marginata]